MPSTPALLETTVRFFTPESRIASDRVSAMPQRPKPPDMIIMPSLRIPSSADLASGYTLFMKSDLMGGGAIWLVIRRILRSASMTGPRGLILRDARLRRSGTCYLEKDLIVRSAAKPRVSNHEAVEVSPQPTFKMASFARLGPR